jgi:aryl-alcohol dehydrogenase-like predicted oxidoreductase
LDEIVAGKGCTIAQFAIAWLLAQPGITSAIIGPRTLQHMHEYFGALDVEITDGDMKLVDTLVPPAWTVLEQ